MKNLSAVTAALVMSLSAISASPQANAAITRQNATGICQGALPAFDTQIRKRPLAIRNEGTASSFVSCSLVGPSGVSHSSVEIVFTNNSAATVTVNCSVVTGRAVFSTAPVFYSGTRELAAGDSGSIIQAFDNAVDVANLVNSSCLLPPGVELDYLRLDSVDPV